MSKVSHEQALAEMESTLELARAHADLLLPLARQTADELEAYIAAFKETKRQQEALLAERIAKTAELTSLIAEGNLAARKIRTYVVLALGTKNPQLSQFGIGIRGRRRRKTRKPSKAAKAPLAIDMKPSGSIAKPLEELPTGLEATSEPFRTAAEPSEATS
jgi:hypothetical protein